MHIYLDDPIFVLRGTPRQARENATQAILLWRCMQVALAYPKGQFGSNVTWIGHDVQVNMRELSVTAAIKQAFMDDLLIEATATLKTNKIRLKELRSLTGKCNHVASLLWTWNPFLDDMWAATETKRKTNAGYNKIWTKQVAGSLKWLVAFIMRESGEVSRTWSVATHLTPCL